MAKTNDFTADSVQIGSIKRSLYESSDGDLVLSDKFYPGGVRLRDIGQFNVALKIDALEDADEDNIIVFSNDGKLKDSGISIDDISTSFEELTDTPSAFTGSSGYFLKVNTGEDAIVFEEVDIDSLQSQITINANNITSVSNSLDTVETNFNSSITDLTDFINADVIPAINSLSGASETFLGLSDTPNTIPTSANNYFLRVDANTNQIVFDNFIDNFSSNVSNLQSQISNKPDDFLELTDTPSSYSGYDGYIVGVSGSSLVFKEATEVQGNFLPLTGGVLTGDVTFNGQISGVDALEVAYDNSSTNLLSENVKYAIDELESNINAISATIRGSKELNTSDLVYSIDYGMVITETPIPLTTLVSPSGGNSVHIESIFDVTDTGFYVELNEAPTSSGFYVNWSVERSNFSKGEDVNEVNFNLNDVLLPLANGGELDTVSNSDGALFRVLEMSSGKSAFFNYTMNNQFVETDTLQLKVTYTGTSTGTDTLLATLSELTTGDVVSSDTQHSTKTNSASISVAEKVYTTTFTFEYPLYQEITNGDILSLKLKNNGGSLGLPLQILGIKLLF